MKLLFKKVALTASVLAMALGASAALAQTPKAPPNIVMIMTDDVAPMDISAVHRGIGAVRTPNIDRIAKEGLMINDYYAQPSCTAGRAAFITGQYPIRTGLTTVGLPGAPLGLKAEDVTLAELLKARGYATGQFGKSHVGDRNEHLPTVHGFDEFFGILYHLNTMEQFEQPEYPKNPNFPGRPRNVLYSWATDTADTTADPRFGAIGKQRIEDRGQLGSKRMETFDDEVYAATSDWLNRTAKTDKPFFLWFNPTRMHQTNHVSPEWRGKSGQGNYSDALLHLDSLVGKVLKQLDDMGVANNTIVMFTSDNGVNLSYWPDSGTPSFRGEKGLTWEGGFRVPMIVRWPGKIPANEWSDQFMTSEDWVPTLMAAVGDSTIKERLKAGTKVGDRDFKVHLDGYDQTAMLTANGKSKRREFFYYAETDLNAMRIDQFKVHFATKNNWLHAADKIDGGLMVNIKPDPFERTPETGGHATWMRERGAWLLPLMGGTLNTFSKSLADFPPRQKGAGYGAASLFDKK
ncbi:MAG: arylsulfatase [Burkholderiales bacterium]